MLLDELIWLFV